MKIAIMGAGGIGGYVGGRLAEAGEEVHLIARGRHLASLKANGLRIESPHGDLTLSSIGATADPGEIGPVDLIIFTVKLGDTDEACRTMRPMVGEQTVVVTLQNGIDAKDIIGRYVDKARIAAGIVYLAAYIKEPGVITNPGGAHRIVMDRLAGHPTLEALFKAGERATAIDLIPTDDGEHTVWGKFIALVAFAGATSIARLPIGAVYENPDLLAFMRQLLDENIAVARARGLDFDSDHADKTIELFRAQPYEQKSSMLVDLESGKPLELAWLSGRVHELGKELGIPTPGNSAVWAALSSYKDGPAIKAG
ncbi:MAG: 2-dehydropantoate 2-reductase [Pseudomonadota bacterium]